MIKTTTFWNWFMKNNSKFFFLNQIKNINEKESILNEFENKLHEFCDDLYFKIGGFPDENQELIITCEGNIEKFGKVLELVNSAPEIKNWKIIAFKQPNNDSFILDINNIKINSIELFFLPLSNPKEPNALGLNIGFPYYDKIKHDDYTQLAHLALEEKLGERKYSLYIKFVDVLKTPLNPEENGYICFEEINDYLSWFILKNTQIN
jgi:hypothetical protein